MGAKIYPENIKKKAVIEHLVSGSTLAISAKKLKVSSPTFKRWVDELQSNEQVVKAVDKAKAKADIAMEAMAESKALSTVEFINKAKEKALELNDLVIDRMKKLIPKETNLQKLVFVYEKTNDVLLKDISEAGAGSDVKNYFKDIETLIINKNA